MPLTVAVDEVARSGERVLAAQSLGLAVDELPALLRREIREADAQELGPRQAGHGCGGRVGIDDQGVVVGDEDRVERAVEEAAEACLAARQLAQRLRAIGDVAQRDERTIRREP